MNGYDLFKSKSETSDAASDLFAKYCASLALYFINYFGENATTKSLQFMDNVAHEILAKHKNTFGSDNKSFNIIGTYGRVLWKKGHLRNEDISSSEPPELQYAKDALENAKAEQDFKYYQELIKDLALLGVLIPPVPVFRIFTQIMKEQGFIVSDDDGQNLKPIPFKKESHIIKKELIRSLANIRVLYKQEVDSYLLDDQERAAFYSDVVVYKAEFQLHEFYSWNFEQLMFRLLTQHFEHLGKEVLNSFFRGLGERKLLDGASVSFKYLLRHMHEKSMTTKSIQRKEQ